MRRQAVVVFFALAALLLAGAAPAQTQVVRVDLDASLISGEGWGDTREVEATLKDSGGQVKGACWVRTDPSGRFFCSWGQGPFTAAGVLPPATNQPGDTLSIEHEGRTYASGSFSNVHITKLDPATDQVGGRIVPRRAKVRVRVYPQLRLTPTAYVSPVPYEMSGTTDAAGMFTVDLTAAGNPVRNDVVFVAQVQGRFEIGVSASFPGLSVVKDSNYGILSGIQGTVRTVRLFSAAGALKSQATVALTGGLGPSDASLAERGEEVLSSGGGYFFFSDPAGRPVPIRQGDVIAVDGPFAFNFRVPRLAPGISASRFSVRTQSNKALAFSGMIHAGPGASPTFYGAFGKSDGTGYYQYDPAPAITPYSSCTFMIIVDGNRVSTSRVLAP